MGRPPIAVALDGPSLETVLGWVRACAPYVCVTKVGLEAYLRDGASGVRAVREASQGLDLFLDLKLHDIPNTVAGAARSVADLRPKYLTVHASGGKAMISAAVEALPDTKITAVTVLTSLSEADLSAIGMAGPSADAAVRLSCLAVSAGARAIVCSPREVAAVRAAVPPEVDLITPGVRPANGTGASLGDQSRVATAEQALADGADLLVVGRPITAAGDPGRAAAELAASLVLVRACGHREKSPEPIGGDR